MPAPTSIVWRRSDGIKVAARCRNRRHIYNGNLYAGKTVMSLSWNGSLLNSYQICPSLITELFIRTFELSNVRMNYDLLAAGTHVDGTGKGPGSLLCIQGQWDTTPRWFISLHVISRDPHNRVLCRQNNQFIQLMYNASNTVMGNMVCSYRVSRTWAYGDLSRYTDHWSISMG